MNYKRVAFKMHLNEDQKEAYIKRHNKIWPELKQLLSVSGISEYSIFLDEETNTLFAFQKVSSNSGSQDLSDNPIVKKWWNYMADIMETNPDKSPVSNTLEEVFYLE
jgi:L-rhamnose mutarotase